MKKAVKKVIMDKFTKLFLDWVDEQYDFIQNNIKKYLCAGYYDYKNHVFVKYDTLWFCNINKIIHKSEKDFLNCKNCNK